MTTRITKASGLLAIAAFMFAALFPLSASAERFRPGEDTIATIAGGSDDFKTLVAALDCTGLIPAVADPDARLTVFAPTDAAFALIGLDETSVCDLEIDALTNILLYHVTNGRRVSPSVINGRNKNIKMLNGDRILPVGSGSLMINATQSSANIVAADILASNGVIHVIDFVLLP